MGVMLGKYQEYVHVHSLGVKVLTSGSPGRWLVAHLLKLVLAYITLNYDIQHMQQRPLNRIFGDSIIPSRTATMMVRRRKQTQ